MVIKHAVWCETDLGSNPSSTKFQLCNPMHVNFSKTDVSHLENKDKNRSYFPEVLSVQFSCSVESGSL